MEDIFSQPIPVISNSRLKFKCDHGASWNRSKDGKVPFKPVVSFDPDLNLVGEDALNFFIFHFPSVYVLTHSVLRLPRTAPAVDE